MKKKSKHLVINQVSPATNAILSAIMAILCVIFILPVLLIVMISFSSKDSLFEVGYKFIPKEFSLEAYEYLIAMGDGVFRSYANTIFYAVVGTISSVFVMAMFAYVLSRKEFSPRNSLTFFCFIPTLFSGGLIPTYILYTRYLEIDNTIWVFLLPGLVSFFNVVILRTFITSTIDNSMMESARLDGANEFQIFIKIVIPLFKAGLASVGLFTFVGKWNDWFTGMMYVKDQELQPIMTFLQKIQKTLDYLKAAAPEDLGPEQIELMAQLPGESARMAITVVAILPLLICYPFFQKYFIKGLTVGSVKG